MPPDTAWHPVDVLPAWRSTTGDRRRRPRPAPGQAVLHEPRLRDRAGRFTISELRDLYVAALGHEVSATNLQRVLVRRDVLERNRRRPPTTPGAGRRSLFRFRSRRLEVTDPFAVLRPRDEG